MSRFDQCTETCTTDCGHCKGQPVAELRAELRQWESGQRRRGMPIVESAPDAIPVAAALVRSIGTEGGEEHDALLSRAAQTLKYIADAASALLAEQIICRADLERLRSELRDKGNDLLDVRGLLSPNGGDSVLPDDMADIGERVAPAVEWLIGEVGRLRAQEPTVDAERAVRRQLTALVGVRLLPAEHQAGLVLARTRGLTLPALLRLLLINELALEPERSSGRRC